jgi:outer membrane protein assembly factor BamB
VPTALLCFGTVALLLCTAVVTAGEEPAELPRFESVCFDDFDDLKGYPSAEELRLLLDPVPGQPNKIAATKRGSKSICNLAGWRRLKAPWQNDSVWRLGLSEVKDLDLHFWAGREGITLRLYPGMYGTWVAYNTTRGGNEPQPRTMALWALDNGKYARSRTGTVEVRFQGGRLVLTRGDLVLLSVPFPGLPQEVYLQGTLNVRGMTMLSSGPAPLPAATKRTAVLRVDKPAAVAWRLTPAEAAQGVQFTKLPDGRVELAAAADVKTAQAAMSIGKPGLYEYLFEVEDAEPGSGVFLGDEQGEPLFRVGFARHVETGQTVFCPGLPNATDVEKSYNPVYAAAPLAGRRQWLRVVYGAGLARCYTSGDGLDWSEIQPNPIHVSGRCATVGLYCAAAKARRAIKLRSLEIRRLDALASLAPAELVERAAAPEATKSPADWHAHATQSQPPEVAPGVWRRACAIRALGDNLPHALGQPVLTWLLDDVLTAAGDWQSKLRALDEAALLVEVGTYGSQPNCPDLGALYERLGQELCRQGHAAPLKTISAAMLRTPSWNIRSDPFPQDLVHCELLVLAQQERWAEVSQCCRRLRYFLRLGDPSYYTPPWKEQADATLHLLRWAEAQAWLSAPRLPTAELPRGKGSLSRKQWRHPLAEHVSKESFSLLAEFDAAVSSGEYRGACQVVSSWSNAEGGGLLPAAKDQRLLQSLAAIMESAMQNAPELRQTMREHYAPVGRLRLKQATTDGDAAAVAAVVLQFYGTEAAADAHLWLGDRWLSRGEAGRAIGHYRESLPNVPAERREGVLARLRLAGAMLGRNAGGPAAAPVELGHARFTAAEFERLVAQLRQARQGNGSGAEAAGEAAAVETPSPAPGEYGVRPWARLDAPNDVLPWGGRGTHAVATGERLIVTTPAVQVAFDLGSGQQKWLHRPSSKSKKSNAAATPRPAVGPGGRLFACRGDDAGSELVCLDAADGRVVWSAAPGSNVLVVSDPMLAGRDLYAVCSVPRSDGTLSLELAILDPQSGRLQSRVALLEFADLWSGVIPCRATLAENRIVGTAGGTVFCCDLLGRMSWVRRQIWSPRPEKGGDAPLWRQQPHEPPLVAGARVYATQPGVWAVECLDLETGRLVWRRGLFDVTDVLGCIERRLIVGTVSGLLALDADSGNTLWRCDVENRLDLQYCGPDGRILCARLQEPTDSKRARQPTLAWVDPSNGRTTAEAPLDIGMKQDATFGPLVVCGARQWVLLTRAEKSKDREVLELLWQKP